MLRYSNFFFFATEVEMAGDAILTLDPGFFASYSSERLSMASLFLSNYFSNFGTTFHDSLLSLSLASSRSTLSFFFTNSLTSHPLLLLSATAFLFI
jgi:hypothetical protein